MLPLNTAAKPTPTMPLNTAAATVPTPKAVAAPPTPPAAPDATAASLTKDHTAVKAGTGTSKLKLDMPKEKPPIKFDGDNQWQTDQSKKDLHLNQRDLFANLLGQVRDNGLGEKLEQKVIGLQEAFNKAETAGDYKECRQLHKDMQQLSQKIMGAVSGED